MCHIFSSQRYLWHQNIVSNPLRNAKHDNGDDHEDDANDDFTFFSCSTTATMFVLFVRPRSKLACEAGWILLYHLYYNLYYVQYIFILFISYLYVILTFSFLYQIHILDLIIIYNYHPSKASYSDSVTVRSSLWWLWWWWWTRWWEWLDNDPNPMYGGRKSQRLLIQTRSIHQIFFRVGFNFHNRLAVQALGWSIINWIKWKQY